MLEVFGFAREPFVHEVGPAEAFEGREYREGLKRLAYGLKCRGLVCVTGKSGSGKTTLLRRFVQDLPPALYRVPTLQYTTGGSLDLLVHLALQLGVEATNIRGRLVRLIQNECAELAARRVHTVLVVDEAHYLAHQSLHDIRLLMTSELDAVRHFTLLLCGHEDLEGRLRTSWLAPLRQRITTWIRLGPLTREETEKYLAHRLQIAGVPVNLFLEPAVFALHQLSGGLPRLLDRLAHHALLAAALEQAPEVNEDHVRLAAEEVPL